MTDYNAPPPRSFWYTPAGADRLLGIHLQHADNLRDPDLKPSDRARAWADFRRERFTELGLEGLTGTAAIYHFDNDFGGHLTAAAQTLHGGYLRATPRAQCSAIIPTLSKTLGWRWRRGVDGIEACLKERCAPHQAPVFLAERAAFAARALGLMDSADALMREREWEVALRSTSTALRAFLEEGDQLVMWLEGANELPTARLLQDQIACARGYLCKPQR